MKAFDIMSQSIFSKIHKKESVEGITRISISGYKSLYEECSIEVRPLTILAGANSSGKSSIMQPLLLMKQTLEATYDPGDILLNGPNVRFTLSEQLFSKFSGKSQTNLRINLEIENNKAISNVFSRQRKKGIKILETTCQENGVSLTFSPEINRQSIILLLNKLYEARNREFGRIFKEGKGEIVEKLEWMIIRERCFLKLICNSVMAVQVEEQSLPIPATFTLYDSSSHTSLFESHIRKLIHVPGLRGNPERTYKTTGVGNEFPGTFEDYVASVVNHWQKNKDDRLRDLGKALETLGLTWKVDARQVNDTQVELRVGRLPRSARGGARNMVSIADVGFGISQVLPVLVALLVAEPGRLVYLEQPEIHLHPRAQAALAEVLADAAKRGVRVVLETHSALLLLAVQSLVAEGNLSPDLVKLHWFIRGEDGMTKVSSTDLDDAGAFGDWPEDFGDVSLQLENRYLNAAEARLWKRSHGS
ncbi:AAA family ATPase [Trichocoleus sp. DQ-U1]|uniref:AAA family ATPase n=1 Tax=Trichocoleus sp. DQ-U1 TaxID=2933926 RepID=UPI0032969CDA